MCPGANGRLALGNEGSQKRKWSVGLGSKLWAGKFCHGSWKLAKVVSAQLVQRVRKGGGHLSVPGRVQNIGANHHLSRVLWVYCGSALYTGSHALCGASIRV